MFVFGVIFGPFLLPNALASEVQGERRAEVARAMPNRSLHSLCISKCTAKLESKLRCEKENAETWSTAHFQLIHKKNQLFHKIPPTNPQKIQLIHKEAPTNPQRSPFLVEKLPFFSTAPRRKCTKKWMDPHWNPSTNFLSNGKKSASFYPSMPSFDSLLQNEAHSSASLMPKS